MEQSIDISCPVCNVAPRRLTRVAQLRQNKISIYKCESCELEFIFPFINLNEQSSSSNTSADYIESMQTSRDRLKPIVDNLASERAKYFAQVLGNSKPRILDVGCGSGWMLKGFIDLGLQVAGIEFDPDLAKTAQELGVEIIANDICNVSVNIQNDFDIVCASQTVEHIFKPRVAIENMVRLLRPGGLIQIDVPSANSWGARLRRYRHGDENWGVITLPHHQIGYHPSSMKALLQTGGLHSIQVMERPVDDSVFGQAILPLSSRARAYRKLSHLFGHGYLLIAVGRKPI